MLERFFQLKSNGTTPAREVLGGVTTFAAIITMIMIPFGFGIANGIAFGCITYCVIMALTGEFHQVKKIMCGLTVLLVLKFIFVGV